MQKEAEKKFMHRDKTNVKPEMYDYTSSTPNLVAASRHNTHATYQVLFV
jgi:hypothetical protein